MRPSGQRTAFPSLAVLFLAAVLLPLLFNHRHDLVDAQRVRSRDCSSVVAAWLADTNSTRVNGTVLSPKYCNRVHLGVDGEAFSDARSVTGADGVRRVLLFDISEMTAAAALDTPSSSGTPCAVSVVLSKLAVTDTGLELVITGNNTDAATGRTCAVRVVIANSSFANSPIVTWDLSLRGDASVSFEGITAALQSVAPFRGDTLAATVVSRPQHFLPVAAASYPTAVAPADGATVLVRAPATTVRVAWPLVVSAYEQRADVAGEHFSAVVSPLAFRGTTSLDGRGCSLGVIGGQYVASSLADDAPSRTAMTNDFHAGPDARENVRIVGIAAAVGRLSLRNGSVLALFGLAATGPGQLQASANMVDTAAVGGSMVDFHHSAGIAFVTTDMRISGARSGVIIANATVAANAASVQTTVHPVASGVVLSMNDTHISDGGAIAVTNVALSASATGSASAVAVTVALRTGGVFNMSTGGSLVLQDSTLTVSLTGTTSERLAAGFQLYANQGSTTTLVGSGASVTFARVGIQSTAAANVATVVSAAALGLSVYSSSSSSLTLSGGAAWRTLFVNVNATAVGKLTKARAAEWAQYGATMVVAGQGTGVYYDGCTLGATARDGSHGSAHAYGMYRVLLAASWQEFKAGSTLEVRNTTFAVHSSATSGNARAYREEVFEASTRLHSGSSTTVLFDGCRFTAETVAGGSPRVVGLDFGLSNPLSNDTWRDGSRLLVTRSRIDVAGASVSDSSLLGVYVRRHTGGRHLESGAAWEFSFLNITVTAGRDVKGGTVFGFAILSPEPTAAPFMISGGSSLAFTDSTVNITAASDLNGDPSSDKTDAFGVALTVKDATAMTLEDGALFSIARVVAKIDQHEPAVGTTPEFGQTGLLIEVAKTGSALSIRRNSSVRVVDCSFAVRSYRSPASGVTLRAHSGAFDLLDQSSLVFANVVVDAYAGAPSAGSFDGSLLGVETIVESNGVLTVTGSSAVVFDRLAVSVTADANVGAGPATAVYHRIIGNARFVVANHSRWIISRSALFVTATATSKSVHGYKLSIEVGGHREVIDHSSVELLSTNVTAFLPLANAADAYAFSSVVDGMTTPARDTTSDHSFVLVDGCRFNATTAATSSSTTESRCTAERTAVDNGGLLTVEDGSSRTTRNTAMFAHCTGTADRQAVVKGVEIAINSGQILVHRNSTWAHAGCTVSAIRNVARGAISGFHLSVSSSTSSLTVQDGSALVLRAVAIVASTTNTAVANGNDGHYGLRVLASGGATVRVQNGSAFDVNGGSRIEGVVSTGANGVVVHGARIETTSASTTFDVVDGSRLSFSGGTTCIADQRSGDANGAYAFAVAVQTASALSIANQSMLQVDHATMNATVGSGRGQAVGVTLYVQGAVRVINDSAVVFRSSTIAALTSGQLSSSDWTAGYMEGVYPSGKVQVSHRSTWLLDRCVIHSSRTIDSSSDVLGLFVLVFFGGSKRFSDHSVWHLKDSSVTASYPVTTASNRQVFAVYWASSMMGSIIDVHESSGIMVSGSTLNASGTDNNCEYRAASIYVGNSGTGSRAMVNVSGGSRIAFMNSTLFASASKAGGTPKAAGLVVDVAALGDLELSGSSSSLSVHGSTVTAQMGSSGDAHAAFVSVSSGGTLQVLQGASIAVSHSTLSAARVGGGGGGASACRGLWIRVTGSMSQMTLRERSSVLIDTSTLDVTTVSTIDTTVHALHLDVVSTSAFSLFDSRVLVRGGSTVRASIASTTTFSREIQVVKIVANAGIMVTDESLFGFEDSTITSTLNANNQIGAAVIHYHGSAQFTLAQKAHFLLRNMTLEPFAGSAMPRIPTMTLGDQFVVNAAQGARLIITRTRFRRQLLQDGGFVEHPAASTDSAILRCVFQDQLATPITAATEIGLQDLNVESVTGSRCDEAFPAVASVPECTGGTLPPQLVCNNAPGAAPAAGCVCSKVGFTAVDFGTAVTEHHIEPNVTTNAPLPAGGPVADAPVPPAIGPTVAGGASGSSSESNASALAAAALGLGYGVGAWPSGGPALRFATWTPSVSVPPTPTASFSLTLTASRTASSTVTGSSSQSRPTVSGSVGTPSRTGSLSVTGGTVTVTFASSTRSRPTTPTVSDSGPTRSVTMSGPSASVSANTRTLAATPTASLGTATGSASRTPTRGTTTRTAGTVSMSKTVPPAPPPTPPSQPKPLPKAAEGAVVGTTTTAAVATGSTTMALQGSRASLALALTSCGEDDDDESSSQPLVALGLADAFGGHAKAAVAAEAALVHLLLLLACSALLFLVGLVWHFVQTVRRQQRESAMATPEQQRKAVANPVSLARSMADLRLPGLLIVPCMVLMEGCFTPSVLVLNHAFSASDDNSVSLGALLVAMFVLVSVLAQVALFAAFFACGGPRPLEYREVDLGPRPPLRERTEVFVFGAGKWIVRADEGKARRRYGRHWRLLIADYRGGREWFGLVEVGLTLAMALAGTLKTEATCQATAIAVVVLYWVLFVAIVALKPHAVPLFKWLFAGATGALAVGTTLTTFSLFTDTEATKVVLSHLGGAVIAAATLVVAFAGAANTALIAIDGLSRVARRAKLKAKRLGSARDGRADAAEALMWGGDVAEADAYGLIRIQALKTTAALRDRQAMALDAGLLDASPEPEQAVATAPLLFEPSSTVPLAHHSADLDALLAGPPTEATDGGGGIDLDGLLDDAGDHEDHLAGTRGAGDVSQLSQNDKDDAIGRGLLFFDTRGANLNASSGNAVTLQMRQELEALLKSGHAAAPTGPAGVVDAAPTPPERDGDGGGGDGDGGDGDGGGGRKSPLPSALDDLL